MNNGEVGCRVWYNGKDSKCRGLVWRNKVSKESSGRQVRKGGD